MTRKEAKELGIGIDLVFTADIFIDKIYDDFKNSSSCKSCVYEPTSGSPYPVECGECYRWYEDKFERKQNGNFK